MPSSPSQRSASGSDRRPLTPFSAAPLSPTATGAASRVASSTFREMLHADADGLASISGSGGGHRLSGRASPLRQSSPLPSAHSLSQRSPQSSGMSLPSAPVAGMPRARVPGYAPSGGAFDGRTTPGGYKEGKSYHPLSLAGGLGAAASRSSGSPTFWDSEVFWLGIYFVFNLGLTLFNKIVLVSFPYPYTLTGLHALSGCIGSYIALERGHFTPAHLAPADNIKLALFSVLYTINIAVSNVSLQLVTVPFHQVVRAATPLFTIFISTVFLRQRTSTRKLVSLFPVIAGVGFATYGDYDFTLAGLILTLFGTFLAALKTVMTNLIQTGGGGRLKLHPLDLLMRMSPLAFVQCVVFSWSSGELERVREYGATQMTRAKLIALLVNGMLAFGLNVVSFTANKKTSALTMTVAANVKQVLTIVLAVIIFDLTITPTNGIGILLTLLGGARYAWLGHTEKRPKSADS